MTAVSAWWVVLGGWAVIVTLLTVCLWAWGIGDFTAPRYRSRLHEGASMREQENDS